MTTRRSFLKRKGFITHGSVIDDMVVLAGITYLGIGLTLLWVIVTLDTDALVKRLIESSNRQMQINSSQHTD